MRTNFNPYPQHDREELNQFNVKLAVYEQEIIKANDRLIEFLNEQLPLMLRHHALDRPLLKLSISAVRQNLQSSNNARAQLLNNIWAVEMGNIEAQRATYFAQQAEAKQRERIAKEERASVDLDHNTGNYFYYKQIIKEGPGGRAIPEKRKTILSPDHQWVAEFKLTGR